MRDVPAPIVGAWFQICHQYNQVERISNATLSGMWKPEKMDESRVELMRQYDFMEPVDPVFARFYQRHKTRTAYGSEAVTLPSGRKMTMAECRTYTLRQEVTRACARFYGLLTEGQGDRRTSNLPR